MKLALRNFVYYVFLEIEVEVLSPRSMTAVFVNLVEVSPESLVFLS